ncbi:tRNA dihydrouridine synthase DusB [candidate division WWE3 bacterium RIFCSPHIGHO2_01_FULL_35_17]|uniref:tRNA-dihydrouridine synthase n=1 Tax=candidate division WWE3 bacterium RIFCSPHIGHO2_01_FULL_35_17 TaxID=1802614 RepID=A0A1F4URC3_UNCKA|nr:MAG: tRNA dihydrouridine synthase DusB [candidate division WWE3 bacterium RIFCSPHIGHO2_01_FULL_35_17]
MADMTDSAFCQIVKQVTGRKDFPIVFREMVSSEAVVRGNDKTMGMTAIHEAERPLIQQIFGSNPQTMAEAAKIIEKSDNPDGFDINMGCPVYKITSNFNGCALMKDPKTSQEIVRKMVEAVKVPISVKIRLGWSDPFEAIKFAPILEDIGATLISVHGRTKEQGYSGTANWKLIGEVKKSVKIPVLANGDIFTPEDAIKALEVTKCDGVLIARGALGNPWIFRQILDVINGKTPTTPSLEERNKVVLNHFDLHMSQYGKRGVFTFRKHLTWYFKGISGIKNYKEKLHTITSKEDLIAVLDEIESSKVR